VGPDLRVILLDTEWLLRAPGGACGTPDEVYAALRDELKRYADRRVVIAAHHPLATGGPHGGNVGWLDHGPLVYWLAVKAGLSVQDLSSGRYTDMLEGLGRAIRESGAPPLAFAAGHDHSLQVIRLRGADRPAFQLVSGSGSRTTEVDRVEGTRWAAGVHGYMRVDVGPGGAGLTVFGQPAPDAADAEVQAVFACLLDGNDADSCPAARLLER
jgi:hypothetical protein